jgi:hypothetical protein
MTLRVVTPIRRAFEVVVRHMDTGHGSSAEVDRNAIGGPMIQGCQHPLPSRQRRFVQLFDVPRADRHDVPSGY